MDTIEDATLKAYDAWPQRVVVIRKDGTLAYRSSGLVGFLPAEVAEAIQQVLKAP